MSWSPASSWSPQPEPEPELEREDPPNSPPTWWTRVSARISPVRLPRDRSPRDYYRARIARDLHYDLESENDQDGGGGGDGADDSYGGGENNDDSDEGANPGGNTVASRIAEISRPQLLPASAVGGEGINGGGNDDINMIDVCPICYEPWTNDVVHRTCCLPCGHLYGLSCIQKCLELGHGSEKCPMCKRAYTLNDVRVHFATRLCAADVVNETPKTHFPFTEEGFSAFQHYVFSRNEALEKRVDALEKRANVYDRRPDALAQRVHELERHSYALDLQVYDMLP